MLGCSADLQLQFEMSPRSLAFQMREKSLTRGKVKHEKAVSRKFREKRKKTFSMAIVFFSQTYRQLQITSIIEVFKKEFYIGCLSKTFEKTINHSAFESRDFGLSNYARISKSIFLTKIAVFDPGGPLIKFFKELLTVMFRTVVRTSSQYSGR